MRYESRKSRSGILYPGKKHGLALALIAVSLVILSILGVGLLTVAYGVRHRAVTTKNEVVDPGMSDYTYVDDTPVEPEGFEYVPVAQPHGGGEPQDRVNWVLSRFHQEKTVASVVTGEIFVGPTLEFVEDDGTIWNLVFSSVGANKTWRLMDPDGVSIFSVEMDGFTNRLLNLENRTSDGGDTVLRWVRVNSGVRELNSWILGEDTIVQGRGFVGARDGLWKWLDVELDGTVRLGKYSADNIHPVTISDTGYVSIGTNDSDANNRVRIKEDSAAHNSGVAALGLFNSDNRHILLGYDDTIDAGFIGSLDPGVTWKNLVLATGGGNVGIGATSPTAKLDINSDILRLRTAKTPASAGAAGNAGDFCWDANYIYICVATNTWKRVAIATW